MRGWALPAFLGALIASNLASEAVSFPATCNAPMEFTRLQHPLRHTAERLPKGEPIKVVAVGSSSTAGAGASSSSATYPSRLAVYLQRNFPDNFITVVNRGVNGDEATNMVLRFERDVVGQTPDLVLWQVGTNIVLRDHPIESQSALLSGGLGRLKAANADVILINPQFAPKVFEKPAIDRMMSIIRNAAEAEEVNLFNRFEVMRYWLTHAGVTFADILSPDQLHMNDWSYDCLAKMLSDSITEAASRARISPGR